MTQTQILASLAPTPAQLEPGAAPPWPAPTGTFTPPKNAPLGCAFAAFFGAAVAGFVAIMFLVGRQVVYPVAATLGVAFLVGLAIGFSYLLQAKALAPARSLRLARLRRAWARVLTSTMVGEERNRGVLSHYLLDLQLEVWEPAPTDPALAHRVAATCHSVRVSGTAIPAALAPQVVPGAFFAVAFDPVDQSALPFSLLTRDGAQFPL